jgi:hypothetical protein
MPEYQDDQQIAEQDVRLFIKNTKAIEELQQVNAKIAKKINAAHKSKPLNFSYYKSIGAKLGLNIAENERVELLFENQGEKLAFLDKLPAQYKNTVNNINFKQIAQQIKINEKLRDLADRHGAVINKFVQLELIVR